ncbi:hypothetical protein ACGFJ7_24265 [Actinoplanes sp. NPDC048988]|uniref:hypothetical protein n=1 Tax=Actinoplanes sp. NPDC048988 TaxID=3363901 RepID=UPI003723B425
MCPFLPTLIGVVLYLAGTRLVGPTHRRAVAVSAVVLGALLRPFVPMTYATVQLLLLAVVVLAATACRPLWFVAALIGAVLVTVGAVAQMRELREVAQSYALYGLPREVAVQVGGEVTIYYLVAVDDQTITAITVNPAAVCGFRAEGTSVRLACQHHSRGASRSLISVVLPYRGGTAWCGDLAACLRAEPAPAERGGKAVVERCRKAATVAPSTAEDR